MRATITTTIETPLCCKELAAALSVSVHFVYQMRACGFTMTWDSTARCEVADPREARAWLRRTKFRVVNGRGKV
jgi:hypothetical protein